MEDGREKWSRKIEYLLATAGYAVGLGNVWRFPYLCYRSGGGAFLIPFLIMLTLCGIPLLYMEMAVGQFTQQGPIGAIGRLCPLFKGAGLATVVISFLFTTYYNVIITWAFYYLFSSLQAVLPWSDCSNDWNSDTCFDGSNKTVVDLTTNITIMVARSNNSISPTEDFYESRLLQKTSGIDSPGALKWDLSLILLFCWILVYFCLWKGPKLTGKVVYFTVTFPYVVLLVLLIRGLTLPGAVNGILYFIVPRWELLLNANVWVNAAAQTFNSLGIAFGGIITMSSYNKRNNRILKDVLAIGLLDVFTCVLAGFAIFSILGYLAHNQGKDVHDVVKEGPGLVFIIYPEAFTSMPVSPLISVLFFLMLITLGIDSQFASVEVIVTTIQDHFSLQVKKYLKRKEFLVLLVCLISFLCGLPNVTQGGIYFFQLIDNFSSAMSLMYLAFFEVIAITWIYGARRLAKDVEMMTGVRPNIFFVVCWYVFSPLLILGIWIFSLVQYTPFSMAGYEYPGWAIGLGWFLAALSIVCIPAGMIHAVLNSKGQSLWQKFLNALKPVSEEETTIMTSDTKERDVEYVKYNGSTRATQFQEEHHEYPNGSPLKPLSYTKV
ncbi:sodium- and chloride-dependent GABA transporter ine-like [Dreissena polymorpha]|uniref:sodium- and chloride-dependent GABA transporter ine-like n=1 Tax=Dreissena polymorpha TaxID=45954 RepID=UPI002264E9A6|nr:sodium- and chloride-dependent GABA transporter ine-like [Dreissena polymorpha]XP_052284259.1 sodium- and chloride-dependent GABA transporter ine-like [Dreissena polymorpha]XP_052284266.1 sodium- and chloride-dependent GABA transporter ine-like [Dreissena polymorpha]XP_052284276.1 sodium- and chloride-dependent GABA transporter ine-like [Dreissena polymorpha]XP_052284285.1 sodium- and chloride-dependent GABA transporter ine-like [Dreissena polymorpha]